MNHEERRRKYKGNMKKISPPHPLQSILCMHSSRGGTQTDPQPPPPLHRGVGSGWEIIVSIGVALCNKHVWGQ